MSARTTLPAPRDRLTIGAAGLRASPLCLGLVQEAAAVPAAFEAGINFFFVTADMHWPLYEPLRRGLADLLARGPGVRDEIVVAAASYVGQRPFCSAPFLEVVAAIPGLRRIDLLVIGGAYADDYEPRRAIYRDNLARALCGAQALGATFHDRPTARRAVNAGEVELACVRYNPSHPGAQLDLFPHLRAGQRPPLFGFKSADQAFSEAELRALGLDEDHWFPEVTDYYRYALSRPELDGLLCAPGTPREVAALIDALAQGPLQPEEEDHLLALAERAQEAARR